MTKNIFIPCQYVDNKSLNKVLGRDDRLLRTNELGNVHSALLVLSNDYYGMDFGGWSKHPLGGFGTSRARGNLTSRRFKGPGDNAWTDFSIFKQK